MHNPFTAAFSQSDGFGKAIFIALFVLSAACWTILVYKAWQFWVVKKLSAQFSEKFEQNKTEPLHLQFERPLIRKLSEVPHPLFDLYRAVKQRALLEHDMEVIESQVVVSISSAHRKLDRHLFVLPMIVTLAPFLGLLGTVWGILLSFGERQTSNEAMLAGLSMALGTTVLGLLVAIPAIVGYSYLKNAGRENSRSMEEFAHSLLAAIKVQKPK